MSDRKPSDPSRQPNVSGALRLAMLGHDLRLALTDIVGGLQLIPNDRLDAETLVQLSRVRASSELLGRLLDDALTLASEQIQPAIAIRGPIALHHLIDDVKSRWLGHANAKGVRFSVSVADTVPEVAMTDRLALDRILSNIISNAIKLTPSGEVKLAVDVRTGGELRMLVRDQGPGFSDEALQSLYAPAAAPEPGEKTGLGLRIARERAEAIGGRLSLANAEDGGAEVVLLIPHEHWKVDDQETKPDPIPDVRGLRVLLAEDNPTSQFVLAQMLDLLGIDFELADDGLAAVDKLSASDFDALLLDIEMPGLSGHQVIERVRAGRAGRADIPILAITAYVLPRQRREMLDEGANDILAKPVTSVDQLARCIGQITGRTPKAADSGKDDALKSGLDHLLSLTRPDDRSELLSRFKSDLKTTEEELVSGLDPVDLTKIRSASHVLVSLSGTLGDATLQRLATQLNAAANSGNAVQVHELVEPVLPALKALRAFVDQQAQQPERAI